MRERLTFLPFLLAVSAVLAVIAAVVGLIVAGGAGAAGAALGVVLVALAYALSTVFIAWMEKINLSLVLVAALVSYSVKLMLMVVVITALGERGWPGLRPMLFAVAGAVFVWICAQSWWIWHTKIPYVSMHEGDVGSSAGQHVSRPAKRRFPL